MTDDLDLQRRLDRNLDAIMGEIAAPPRSRGERALLALRVPEPTARLVAATPVLRGAWMAAVGVVLLFASVAAQGTWHAGDQLAIFLSLAPIVPVVGVAMAYGPQSDRGYEVAIAAPLSGLRLLLLRTVTVLAAAGLLALVAVLAAPTHGLLRVAWLLPGLATTTVTLAAATRLGVRRAAYAVATTWLVVVIVAAQVADDATAPFRWAGQIVALSAAVVAAVVLAVGRRRLDRWPAGPVGAP
jgi:hypothetical protein